MNSEELRRRTMDFSLRVIGFSRLLPKSYEGQIMGKQLLRSSTSVAANYRAAGRARSKREFVSKLSIVVEEADEAVFWLELIRESNVECGEEIDNLMKEAKELLYIFSASRRSAKEKITKPQITKPQITKS